MRVRDGLFKLIGLCLVAGVLVAGLLFPAAGGAGILSNQMSSTVDDLSADLTSNQSPLVTRVLDKDGNQVASLYDQYRLPAAPEQISQNMKAAMVAVEDRRFFDHGGVDLKGTLRAAINDVGGGSTQGASSITQQYVKNFLVNVVHRNNKAEQLRDQEANIARKLREARISMQLEQRMSKDQILAGYLNVVTFSSNVYGVGAAAKTFFDTTPDKLTIPQSALLAGMVNNPIVLDPWKNPDKALQRRNFVLDKMAESKAITTQQAQDLKKEELGIVPERKLPSPSCVGAPDYAGFFCDYVKQYLEENGFTKDQIESGGYTIKTSLDPKMSKAARDSVKKSVPPGSPNVTNSFAVVGSGPQAHQVQAMVANRTYGTDADEGGRSYNVVSDPSVTFGGGSTFKIFTSAAALENGDAGLNTVLPNPKSVSVKRAGAPRFEQPQHTSNLNGTGATISLRSALEKSPNTAFFLLENKVGLSKVLQMAQRLGLRHTMQSNTIGNPPITDPDDQRSKDDRLNQPQSKFYQTKLSFTLGVSAVSPLEMSNVMSTINSGGTWCPPNPVLSITDRDGKPVPVPSKPCEQVISPDVAKALAQGMSEDTIGGTSAAAARAANWNRPDFAKTGTTNSNESVAFTAGVDNYGVASMVYSDGSNPAPLCGGKPIVAGCSGGDKGGAFGGSAAGPPYFDAFNAILGDKKVKPVPQAPDSMLTSGGRAPLVPYVLDQDADSAKEALRKAGYGNVVVKKTTGKAKQGTVIAETPQGNVVQGQQITLYTSDGKQR
ncbi:transglycosylase domain-containing protein [Sciscionella marina]|uniref:transglycosylase domain-containing protein n=1 Tax=Sciscionella marina TaxID=508770 RepID=UPI00036FF224|nr:transglycosylase domain-containing protein [Sciscionella marina]